MIFKEIEELQAYVSVDSTLTLETLKPHMRRANRQTAELIGGRLWEILAAAYKANRFTPRLERLLPVAQECVAHYTMLYFAPAANIRLSDAGMHSRESADSPRPYRYERREYLQSLFETAEEAAERLLQVLEKHERDYPEWHQSESCTLLRGTFVRTAADMQQHVNISNSRKMFVELKPFLQNVEGQIRAALGAKLFEQIKEEMRELRLMERHQVLIPHLQKAAAHLAAAASSPHLALRLSEGKATGRYKEDEDRETHEGNAQALHAWRIYHEGEGKRALAEAKRLIEERIYLYPSYKKAEPFTNKGDSSVFIL